MKQIFLYEFATGGGALSGEVELVDFDALIAEGASMLRAMAHDFAGLDDIEVVTLQDQTKVRDLRIPGRACQVADAAEERQLFEQLARESAWTMVIAPELNGVLARRLNWVRNASGTALNCSADTVSLASDKHALAEHLLASGVPAPAGMRVAAGAAWPLSFDLPAVLKPCDGAGSCGVQLIAESAELARRSPPPRDHRLEAFCPGQPASVAFLCGPAGNTSLTPCRQQLGGDSGFEYQGGSLPLDPLLAERASRLARRAIVCLPGSLGFVGVDLILGSARDGSRDYVIEINPRLTTSYLGLRAVARQNLAGALLNVAAGRDVPLEFNSEPVDFTAAGTVLRPKHGARVQPQFEVHGT
jgi:predicted ATP-grasp superfamily ATP-dependent carboligase